MAVRLLIGDPIQVVRLTSAFLIGSCVWVQGDGPTPPQISGNSRWRRPVRYPAAQVPAKILARLKRILNIARITVRGGGVYGRRLGNAADLTVDGWLCYVGSSRLGVGRCWDSDRADVSIRVFPRVSV